MAEVVAEPQPVEDINEDTATETEDELLEESNEETETIEETVDEEPISDETASPEIIAPVANVTETAPEGEKGMWLKLIKLSLRHLMVMIHSFEMNHLSTSNGKYLIN